MAGLDEAEHGELRFELVAADGVTLRQSVPVELLARDEWGGLGEMAPLLAAFVSTAAVPGAAVRGSRLDRTSE